MRYLLLFVALLLVSCDSGPSEDKDSGEVTVKAEVAELDEEEVEDLAKDEAEPEDLKDLEADEDQEEVAEDLQDLEEDEDSTDTGAPCDCPEPPALPPRWVLRDKDGVEVEGIFRPGGSLEGTVENPILWNQIDCVSVQALGAEFIGLSYDISSGSLLNCQVVGNSYFADSECLDPVFYASSTLRPFAYEGQVLIPTDLVISPPQPYYIRASDGSCSQTTNSSLSFRGAAPIDSRYISLLPNPPYSLTVE